MERQSENKEINTPPQLLLSGLGSLYVGVYVRFDAIAREM